MLRRKVIAVGITGGIAAYKVAELVSRLTKKGYEVHVIMTASAQKFITPLTFRTLSGNPVITDMFDPSPLWNVQHVSLAEKADAFVVVPATANIIGKIANGLADDMLSTTVMAAQCPVVLAPAMNVHMWENPVVQSNIKKLEELGYRLVDPGVGRLACGTEGKGRLADIDCIEQALISLLEKPKDFFGKKVLVTAGPTREAIDPVRYLTNHSTGKMGYEIARAAKERGAEVFLVSGPTNLADPEGVIVERVVSAREMFRAVSDKYEQVDIVIKAAAVADYRPKQTSAEKIKKADGEMSLTLERNPDILWELGRKKDHQLLVGFAAETGNLIEFAQNKMERKNLDMIVANNVSEEGAGFGGVTNKVTILNRYGELKELPQMTKYDTAHAILDQIRLLADTNKS
ncbi:MAG: bifunctional phosphopantothenoylcysteine decarboxylase/phosphopantothenate--cysteine ligase CoaBC [Desulfitobacteriaceae bacterium]|nr:bifunctional phosphopantothenoylcysteine decarboxylase/phosphopantothenate--cysteine ligase CoaBC [Desulfitobacteriaceae bacterium]